MGARSRSAPSHAGRKPSPPLAQVTTEQRQGRWVTPAAGRITFGEFTEQWAAGVTGLRQSTWQRDLNYIRWYITGTFGEARLDHINHLDIQQWVADMDALGYAPGTIARAYQIIGKIFDAAVRSQRLPINPAIGVKLPKKRRAQRRALSMGELHRLADAIDQRYRALVLVGDCAGCGRASWPRCACATWTWLPGSSEWSKRPPTSAARSSWARRRPTPVGGPCRSSCRR
jgi:hypothetical protein